DGMWNDDFHHSTNVALTGRREAYYEEYQGSPREMVASAVRGFLYQGQRYGWQGKRRGRNLRGSPSWMLVDYLENHDQIAN
ncbi:malto-oligosyltrehalose trehalohydrolase, partial [Klebsiella pneumoniae]|nr:malto-oligosyltrehalose trehalohydrolase [Klebsiella pneumoniae]